MGERVTCIDKVCDRALDGVLPDDSDLRMLLSADGAEREVVLSTARALRHRTWGETIFLYGFVYFSTYCRNHCAFCLYRAGNAAGRRYRKSLDEVVAVCRDLAESGVVLVDLTMGEDPEIHSEPGYRRLRSLVGAVSREVGLPVMVSPGVVPDAAAAALRGEGAEWYALYQEAYASALYERLRSGQPFAARVAARRAARRAGLLVEDGILTGVGDTIADRANAIVEMRRSGCEQVRVMSLVPQLGTPMAATPSPAHEDELLTIAAMRLAMPERFIPASLDVDGIDGLERRLQAGANIVTSLVPPGSGFAGVSQAALGIDEGQRTVASVLPRLHALGLRAGSAREYRQCLMALRHAAHVAL